MLTTGKSEEVAIRLFFVLEDGWFKEFVGGGVSELGELGIVFSHEVHDVAQRRHVQGVALQCRHHDRAQPPYNFAMLRV